jgi:hypothetical protein
MGTRAASSATKTRIIEYLQRGPSCDLDEHGNPIPPKYIPVTGWPGHPDDETR